MVIQLKAIIINVPDQYLTIQEGINVASYNDTVLVTEGEYYENLQIIGKEITLTSLYLIDQDPLHINNTIINGSDPINPDEASVIAFLPGDSPHSHPQVIGFIITGGSGWLIEEEIQAPDGPIYIEKKVGGGLYINQMDPIFTSDKIEDNDAEDEGGGSYSFLAQPNFGGGIINNPGNNIFYGNTAPSGNSIYAKFNGNPQIIYVDSCTFDVYDSESSNVPDYWIKSEGEVSTKEGSGFFEAISGDIFVSSSGNDNNSGLSPDSPLKHIWYALSITVTDSLNPTVIHISGGTYSRSDTGEKFPLPMASGISLYGDFDNNTVLDSDFSDNVLFFEFVENNTIKDLVITRGESKYFGGGIKFYHSTSIFENVTIIDNTCQYSGGGIWIEESNLTLSELIITGNHAGLSGGGIYCNRSTVLILEKIVIENNISDNKGGGIGSISSHLNISDTIIRNNIALSDNGGGIHEENSHLNIYFTSFLNNNSYNNGGGIIGISSTGSDNIIDLKNCLFKDNIANTGGAIYSDNTIIDLEYCSLSNNYAIANSGAIYLTDSETSMYKCLFSENYTNDGAGSIFSNNSYHMNIINCVFINNTGNNSGGIGFYNNLDNSEALILLNTIFWNNINNELYCSPEGSTNKIVSAFNDIQGGEEMIVTNNNADIIWLEGNIDKDPIIIDATGNEYNIREDSPFVDSGTAYFDYNDEIILNLSESEYCGSAPDMGTFEFNKTVTDSTTIPTYSKKFRISTYPNPFNPSTNIEYYLDKKERVRIDIYNLRGQKVTALINEVQKAGSYCINWDASGKSSGVYILNFIAGKNRKVEKVILLK